MQPAMVSSARSVQYECADGGNGGKGSEDPRHIEERSVGHFGVILTIEQKVAACVDTESLQICHIRMSTSV